MLTIVHVLMQLLREQDGIISRRQALDAGLSRGRIEHLVKSGRWQRIYPGIYAAFTGKLSPRCRLWTVVLWAGDGAALCHETAAAAFGLGELSGGTVHVRIPANRRFHRIPAGVVVHRSRRPVDDIHPTRRPPCTRIEVTVLDLVQATRSVDDAIGWLARAVGSRLTTAEKLLDALRRHPRVRWRRVLEEALGDVKAGCHSLLEVRYFRDVEDAHGLPRGERQVPAGRGAERRFDDVVYREYRTRVELDGRAYHPEHLRFRDNRRDNAAAIAGIMPLRFGPDNVFLQPWATAAELAGVLTDRGWGGKPTRCRRPTCIFP